LGGKTGSQKTEIIHLLSAKGEQIIDLEGLAKHKGSAFGNLEGTAQPSHDLFQYELWKIWTDLDSSRPVWIEEEGKFIGKAGLPTSLYSRMQVAPMIELLIPFNERLNHIYSQYAACDHTAFAAAIRKLKPRMGRSNNDKAVHLLKTGRMKESIELLLNYYDEGYSRRRVSQRKGQHFTIEASTETPDNSVKSLLNLSREMPAE
jgi:tRNA 2-selenouridine synthase